MLHGSQSQYWLLTREFLRHIGLGISDRYQVICKKFQFKSSKQFKNIVKIIIKINTNRWSKKLIK